ncbi:hypothetical protein DFH28DRAFT_1118338 [Melampsora americana]|nr:hypothetical protein DFH28DRAFT_1118338 [Melampsora americana]
MDEGSLDLDMQDVSTARDDVLTYDDAMDALGKSDLTGQTTATTPKTRPTTSFAFDKAAIPPLALTGPVSSTPAMLEGSRKRTRHRAPSPSPLDEAEEITETPRSTRISKLFPGSSAATAKPLGVLVQKLIDVSKAALIPKSKTAKSIKVDIESAADILAARQHPPPSSSSSFAANAQFEFRNNTLIDKVNVMADQIAKLVSVSETNQQQQPPTPAAQNSYASAASKKASGPSQGTKRAQTNPQSRHKQPERPKVDHSVTLNHQDPSNITGAGISIPELIKQFNAVLKDNNIKQNSEDKSSIMVRNIHRHPSGDLVIYLESQKQAQALRGQASCWIPKISSNLTIKQEVYPVIVHGIPTTFNPTREEDIDLLNISNGDLLDDALFPVWWLARKCGMGEADTAQNSADQDHPAASTVRALATRPPRAN